MPASPLKNAKVRPLGILTWLHFAAAVLVVTFSALFSAIHSPLGREISAGESPGFAWIREHIIICLGLGLIYLILVCWIQFRQMRQTQFCDNKLLQILVIFEVLSVTAIAMLFSSRHANFLPWVHSVLLISLLSQGVYTFWCSKLSGLDQPSGVYQMPMASAGSFLFLLFIFGAVISFVEPSWRGSADQILLDSGFEYHLRNLSPPILSGVTSVWFGIGMLSILQCFSRLLHKFHENRNLPWILYFLMFFSLVAVFMGFLFFTLYYAISWQIVNLHLIPTVWQFIVFFSVTGGILFSTVFYRLVSHMPQPPQGSLIGIVSLTFGATLLFPITWLLTHGRKTKITWIVLLTSTIAVCGFTCYFVLFSGLFNPWFTTFSYLKGAILKIMSVGAAGTCVLLMEWLFSFKPNISLNSRRLGVTMAITAALGFLPFYAIGKYPEVKVAALQFNELARVDTTFAREMTNALGLGRWIHLGQRPAQNESPHPWPNPWRLEKTHASRLPDNFNLLVIVVDALRGDAFHSAGYHRNLTPFLDSWAKEEAVSFRRAYSQGGGTFAAFPFLVAGRSRFDLYGPELYQQNLYLKIARAEGIRQFMVMKGFGPRDIYPPDLPVTELTIPHAVSDRRSATADEVFESAQNAIRALPEGERFLSFLHLMDVHNDLWKKVDGIDFGNTPRDLYDNNLSYIDRAFSRFIAWLKEEGIYNRTVILFTSDHGEQFWEHGASLHGHTVYEEEIRIPLILGSHGIRKRYEDVPVIAADMAPTLADLAGYSVDPPYDDPRMGISLLPLLMDNKRQQYLDRDVVGRASFKRRYFLYRNWEWKLVYFAELDLLQLFNVVEDPLEKNNLIHERPILAATLEFDLMNYLEIVEGKTYRCMLSKLPE
jgi:glucan phosphoethanolaminetransferase (alkaline phosphatase superfamily)